MRGTRGYIRTLVVGIMIISLFATMLMAAVPGNVSAAPAWQVGDKWALAGEKDIGQIWDTLAPLIVTSFTNSGPPMNLALSSSNFQGRITMDAVFEVMAITASNITVQIKIAGNATISASAVINGDFPAAGVYSMGGSQPTYVNKDVSVSSKLVAASSGTIIAVLTSNTMAIESMDATVSSYMKGYIAVTNYPDYVYNQAQTEVTVSYVNANCPIDISSLTSMHAVVSPAILVISDTMSVGDFVDASATMTASETISGSANIGNLPASIRDMYFTSSTAQWGMTGFPINLAGIHNPDTNGMPIHDGTIDASSGPLATHMVYLRNTNVNDVSGSVEAREYGLQQGGSTDVFTFLLNPANGHTIGTTSIIPMSTAQVLFTTHAAAVGTTQTAITKINTQVADKQSYATVTGDTSGSGGSGASSGISSDMLIIIGVVAVVVVGAVVGVVVMRRKK